MSAGAGVVRAADLDDLLAAPIVDVEGRSLTGRDLLAAGVVSGRWPALERDLARGLGLVAMQAPPEAEVVAEVRDFRLARKLFSAEDARAWMAPRGLTMPKLKAAAARAVARRHAGDPQPVDPGDVAATLPAEAIFTGTMEEIAWWLVDRMLGAKASGADVEPGGPADDRVRRLVAEESRTVAGGQSPEPAPERERRLAWIAALDDHHRVWQERNADPRALARVLRERELGWCRFELDELRLATAGAAAEVALQLGEGRSPEAVAASAGISARAVTVVFEDADEGLARALTGALAGGVAGPWADGDEHVVAYVRERRPPDIEDEAIRARARAELLVETATRLRAGRLRWHDRI